MLLVYFVVGFVQTLVTWLRDADENVTSTIDLLLTQIVQEHLLTGLTVHDLIWGYRSDTLERANLLLKYKFNITLFNDTMFGLEYQVCYQLREKKLLARKYFATNVVTCGRVACSLKFD